MGRRAAEGPWPAGGSPGRRSCWSGGLLAASILSSCFLLIQTQNIPVRMLPAQPRKGETVTLIPGGKGDYDTCTWYRGEEAEMYRIFTHMPTSLLPQQNGPEFTGREAAGPGCSLIIRSLDVSDSEIYTVTKFVTGGQEKGRVKIRVSAPGGCKDTPMLPSDPRGSEDSVGVSLQPPGVEQEGKDHAGSYAEPQERNERATCGSRATGSHGFGLRTIGKIMAWALPGTVLIGVLVFYTVYRRRQVDQMVMMSSVPAPVAAEGGKV